MHPVAEAALGIAAQVGQKAAKRAAGAALDAVTQSVLEDVGDVGDKAKAVRQAIRGEPISAVVVEDEEGAAMPRRKRRVEEEEDIDLEDEDEEGDYGEVDDDDDDEEEEARPRKMDDDEFIERLEDAETLTKLALSILEECVKRKTFPRRTFKLLERAHDGIEDRLEEIS
jgi:hypothetical protein